MDRLCDQPRRKDLAATKRSAGPEARRDMGKGRGHVPACALRRGGWALSDVVFRRRAERTQRHRIRHQPRRPALDEMAGQPGFPAGSDQRMGAGSRDGLPGGPGRQGVSYVLHRFSRRGPRPDRCRPVRGRPDQLAGVTRPIRSFVPGAASGMPMPSTSHTRSSTAGNGFCGTMEERQVWNKSAWRRTPAASWDSEGLHNPGSMGLREPAHGETGQYTGHPGAGSPCCSDCARFSQQENQSLNALLRLGVPSAAGYHVVAHGRAMR